jgi:hypothetical protein
VRTTRGFLTTKQYAQVNLATVRLRQDAFFEFQDIQCSLQPAPYFKKFIEALQQGSPVIVISARALEHSLFRKLVSRAAALGGERLSANVQVVCANSKQSLRRYGRLNKDVMARKVAILKDFIQRHPRGKSVGFSDDDPKNLRAVQQAFSPAPRKLKVCIYDARTKRKRVLA